MAGISPVRRSETGYISPSPTPPQYRLHMIKPKRHVDSSPRYIKSEKKSVAEPKTPRTPPGYRALPDAPLQSLFSVPMLSLNTTPSSACSLGQVHTPKISTKLQLPNDHGRGVTKASNLFHDEEDFESLFVERPLRNPCAATPKRQTILPYDFDDFFDRSQTEAAMIEEYSKDSKLQYTSLRSVATVIVLLRRFITRGLSRYKSGTHGEKHQVAQILLKGKPSNSLSSKNVDITSWLGHSERTNSSPGSSSINSLERNITEDESREQSLPYPRKEGTPILWERQVIPKDFIALAKRTLKHLRPDIAAAFLDVFEDVVESWVLQHAPSSEFTTSDSTTPSFNFSQNEGGSHYTSSKSDSQKRRQDEDGEDGEQSPDRGDDNPRKRQKLYGGLDMGEGPKWACPFYQREPERYCVETEFGDFRKCAKSPGFPQVHRVKEHIYKCHSPKYCDRCYAVFGTEDELTSHRRGSPACELKELQPLEGLTNEQTLLLKPRDRSSKSDEERWNVIYKICFPDDEMIPSPYYVHYSREVADLRREVLGILQEAAQSRDNINFNRVIQRVEESFNAQRFTPAARGSTPRTPGVLTPSTSNSSGSRFSQATRQDVWQNTPSVLRTSRLVASATGPSDLLPSTEGFGNELGLALTVDDSSYPPLHTSHDSEPDRFLGFELPQTYEVIPFRGFTAPIEDDVDFYQAGEGLPSFRQFDFSLPDDENDIVGLRGQSKQPKTEWEGLG